MKYLNWETGNLPRHAKMSHKLRSMMKMRDRHVPSDCEKQQNDNRKAVNIPGVSFSVDRPYYTYNIGNGDRIKWIPSTGEFVLLMNADRLFKPEPSTLTKAQAHEVIGILADATPALKQHYHRMLDEGGLQ